MQSSKDQLIVSSMLPDTPKPNKTMGYGLILRFGSQAWNGNTWTTHQRVMQANTLILTILENHNPSYISRSTTGCEAVFTQSDSLLDVGIQLQQYIHERQIPACIVLYRDHGYLEKNIWLSAEERRAEYAALLGNQHELLLFGNIKDDISLPIGVGMLPASKHLQKLLHESLWTLHVYQDDPK